MFSWPKEQSLEEFHVHCRKCGVPVTHAREDIQDRKKGAEIGKKSLTRGAVNSKTGANAELELGNLLVKGPSGE